jgi:two-component system, OmpR family, sensor kinase
VSRLPIRIRLTLVFVIAMAAVLTIIGLFLFFSTKNSIDDSIAQSLRARQGAARAYVESAGGAIPPGERFAQVLTPAGAVVASRASSQKPLLTPKQAAKAATGVHQFEWHEHARYLAGPAVVDGRRVVVVVGASLADHEHALEGLTGALLVGGPLALLLAAITAYLIAGAALAPVEDMRRQAATISSADPSAQLPEPPADDEIKRLSVTLNEMLRRIGQSAEYERRFIANASHELRTPLTALQAELELAERHASTPDELRAAIGRSRQDVARLIRLSNELLELAAADDAGRIRVTPVALDDLARMVVADLAHRSEAEDREIRAVPSGLTVDADAEALRRAVGNLVENALVHGSGAVTITAALTDDGREVEIAVHDEGSLHPSLAGGRAFERFGRGADTSGRPGAGLGLALVRSIAEQHGGSVGLAGDEGGVRAVLRLPVSRPE